MAKPESHAGLKTPLLPPRPPTPPIPKGPTPPAKPVFTLPTATDLAARKKGLGARSWLRLDSQGNSQLLEADKYAIMRRCGIPARDLRILDPLLAYPSTILGREKAIVVNLEAIKAIITADEVLLLNPMDAAVLTYTEELQRRLQPPLAGPAHGGQPWLDAPPAAEGAPLGGGAARMGHVRSRSETDLGSIFSGESGGVRDNNERGQPFEFRALEMALEMACSQLHHQSEALEQEAFPALDELTSKISTLNLERVRRLKSRLMALTVRVQKMRDEVEQLLDDDDDMAEMYLSEKRQKLEPAPESPLSTYSGVTARTPRTPFGSAFTRNTLAEGSEADDGDSPPHLLRRDSRASRYGPPA